MMRKRISIIWLLLGSVSLWVKQSLDLRVWNNEGGPLDVAVVFTNSTPADSILWIGFSLFGALFVLSKVSDTRELYPLFPGRILSRKRLIIKEMMTIYRRTGAYVLLVCFTAAWGGPFTSGAVFSFLYAWIALSFLVAVLLLLENRYGIWLVLLIFSTIAPLSSFLPWMYGQGYEIWLQGTAFFHTCLLLVLTTGSSFLYLMQMKTANWG